MSLDNTFPSVHTRATSGLAPGGLGRGLFASTSTIHTGEDVLHVTSPFVAVLETDRLEDTCSGCFGKGLLRHCALLKGCSGCKVVKYCNTTCQKADWKFAHAQECSIFQSLRPRILPINARALLRIVVRCARQKYAAEELDLFSRLETHVREIRDQNPAQWERIVLTSKAVKTYSGTDLTEELISAFGARLELNSFNFTTAIYDRIGLYFHPYAALVNHDCDYNAIVGFDGEELFIKAIRPIQPGEQIFISYIDTTNPVKLRRKELHERYYFNCQCSKCKHDLSNPQNTPPTTQAQDLSAEEAAEQKAFAILDKIPESSLDLSAGVEVLQSTMQSLRQTYSLPITRQPLVSLRDGLIVVLQATQNTDFVFIQCAIRYLRVDPIVYKTDLHPIRQLHAYMLAKAAVEFQHGMKESLGLWSVELGEPMLIAWSIANRLVETEDQACTVPGFQRMVRWFLGAVNEHYKGVKKGPKKREDDIRREWERLELMVDMAIKDGY
ncbi:hypothetical protein BDV28DRAFT_26460 [Aspergillus coremiiformis]|uniref:Uncharacterized protein n=1 Tax=Aspergillus coremiiformis TaxID=138285 RepID=A0A5N6Z0Y0_9EURO|nr:hypothetical protein BDV28DRAFT_26460 [Aspergillus coremiiformis]